MPVDIHFICVPFLGSVTYGNTGTRKFRSHIFNRESSMSRKFKCQHPVAGHQDLTDPLNMYILIYVLPYETWVNFIG